MSAPKQYRKKPVVIETIQWDGSADSASFIIDWALEHGVTINYWCEDGEECRKGLAEHKLAIPTLEGRMSAVTGDFIIMGVQGEFYPCKPDIFAATYEEA